MFSPVYCTYCNKTGVFDLEMVYTYKVYGCDHCHRDTRLTWKYWFCDLKCQTAWWQSLEIAERGLPCQGCMVAGFPTGFESGFETNRTCRTCNGALRVK